MSGGACLERPAATACDGFTLIEMLVTLAILALAATLGSRSIVLAEGTRQPGRIAGSIAAEIDRLRAEAIRTGQTVRLVYDPEAGRFLSSRPGAAPIPAEALQVSVTVPASGRGAPGEIRLLPDGSASGGRIALLGRRAGAVVTVAPLTGRVRWEPQP
ncbi:MULTISPECIES: GspH/FimT family pseudopilin [unclassified Methylobacterium]|uniref:GspH/FimT family pseudopilin n=1 Tax=unclassified Methylobacterium TaxID=2615210 RepID=UPI00370093BA